ncbi:hypothetical protein K8T06_09600 [bacterium]|nr:hypothetical protein [bacterium]
MDLDKTDFGPVAKRFLQSRGGNLPDLQRKLDHLSSLIFSVLFLIIVLLLVMAMYISICLSMALILQKYGMPGTLYKLFFLSFAVAYGFTLSVTMSGAGLDKWFAKDLARLDRYPRLVKLTHISHTINHYLILNFLTQPVTVVIRSQISGRRFTIIASTIFSIMFISFIISIKAGEMNFDSYIYMPVQSVSPLLNTASYDSMKKPGDPEEIPSIQSDIIDGNTEPIRLFLPFYVLHNNLLLEELCPDLEPFHKDGLYKSSLFKDTALKEREIKVQNALDCTKKLFQIELDDQSLDDIDPLFSRHQVTGKGGLLIYISTKYLESGQHTLKIQVKRKRKDRIEDIDYFIPFWLQKT